MSIQKKYDFGWGNPHFLLDILSEMYQVSNSSDIKSLVYGPYGGTDELIHETHNVILKTTGRIYKHILITNGASSAINLLLRKYKAQGGDIVCTSQYGYPSYEDMIKRAGLTRLRNLDESPTVYIVKENGKFSNRFIRLIDSPENPTGEQYTGGNPDNDIWDGVYHNSIYTKQRHLQPKHKYFVGSYSKLLGIAGARIGFIATNDTLAYEGLLAESRNEMTGISRPSQDMVTDILQKLDLDRFMDIGRDDLYDNKTQFQKIEYLFDGQEVNKVGMFYCAKVHPTALKILDNADVNYVMLDKETIRLSMGHTRKTTKDGIRAILKEDNK